MAKKNLDIVRRLIESAVEQGSCWIWSGERDRCGYGHMKTDDDRLEYVHVVSYKIFIESIASGMTVCHNCDRPLCINPDHLFLRNDISGEL
jgi:hypothetical protein